eukprot:SAG22_NODE_18504_length_286_cov_0.828877_1_plen_23_part_01
MVQSVYLKDMGIHTAQFSYDGKS